MLYNIHSCCLLITLLEYFISNIYCFMFGCVADTHWWIENRGGKNSLLQQSTYILIFIGTNGFWVREMQWSDMPVKELYAYAVCSSVCVCIIFFVFQFLIFCANLYAILICKILFLIYLILVQDSILASNPKPVHNGQVPRSCILWFKAWHS